MDTTNSPMTTTPMATPQSFSERWKLGIKGQAMLMKGISTLILAAGAVLILIPLLYMISISLRDRVQIRQASLDLIPSKQVEVQIDGKDKPLYDVVVDGEKRQMALIKKAPGGKGIFADPATPDQTYELILKDQTLVTVTNTHPENYPDALTAVPFGQYFLNTLIVTFLGMAGMLFSCSLVAYGFSRFRARGLNVMFLLLLSTIMLPRQVTLIPVYILFNKIG